jgi:RNA polymerase sigma-70 factor (ECF subfamily)
MQMDHWRKRRFEAQWEEGWDAPSPTEKGLEQAQETELLHKALGLLPPSKREILVMARFQGMKHEEIAAVIGCEPAAARVRLHRALASLKETYLGLLRRREAQ